MRQPSAAFPRVTTYFAPMTTAATIQANPLVLDRALGSFLGLAVGDALGATVEFMTAREITARYQVHREMIGGGWLGLKAGHVTDDTEMALALSSAVIASGGWNLRAIADAFVAWMRRGPADIGNTCRRGLTHYIITGNTCASYGEENCGNGAAMRHLPVVFCTLHDETLLMQRCYEQAHITHNHPVSDAAITTLARMTRRLLLEGAKAPCNRIADELVSLYPQFRYKPWPGRTSGYVVDTVQTVFDAFFSTGSFEDCLVRVVNRGGDADTTGALAGQLAGALYGVEGIPARWLKKLDPAVTAAICQQTPRLLNLPGQ
jgi:ADP-ribosyl-[dinitrogen reductase] hydrolase